MGQALPTIGSNLTIHNHDEFQSKYLQRVKQTPFINSALICSSPPIFVDLLEGNLRLATLVTPRMNSKQLFPEEEVWKVAQCGIGSLKQLKQRHYEGHGDVGLHTIYYWKKDKSFKLSHPILNEDISGYILTKKGKRFTALSPQQLAALSLSSDLPQISFQSDIFSLGIALCEMCTLLPTSDIYCPDTYSIFHLQIQKRLKIISQYYSRDLTLFISRSLQYDIEQRASIQQLWKIIKR